MSIFMPHLSVILWNAQKPTRGSLINGIFQILLFNSFSLFNSLVDDPQKTAPKAVSAQNGKNCQ